MMDNAAAQLMLFPAAHRNTVDHQTSRKCPELLQGG